jgi:hypothetical protein
MTTDQEPAIHREKIECKTTQYLRIQTQIRSNFVLVERTQLELEPCTCLAKDVNSIPKKSLQL